jgi:hypothetical protein
MTRSRLRVGLAASTVLLFLLTPFGGLEPRARPLAAHGLDDLLTTGLAVPPAIILAMGLNVAALALLTRRPRRAASLASAGVFLAGLVLVLDQLGLFSTRPAPTVITALEYGVTLIEAGVLVLALGLLRAPSLSAPVAPTSPRSAQ